MTRVGSATDTRAQRCGAPCPPVGGPGDSLAFRSFAQRLAAGDGDAASELLARYSARLVVLARRNLGRRLTVRAEPEDVLQSVLRTFYRRLSVGDVELRDWASLSGYLSVLTLRKCQRQAEWNLAGKRDVRREASLGDDFEVPDREPTPEEAAVFADLLRSLLESVDDRDRQVLEGLIAGEPASAVAERVGCSRRTVYRTVERLRDRLVEESA